MSRTTIRCSSAGGVTDNGKAYLVDMIRGKWEAPGIAGAVAGILEQAQSPGDATLRYMKVEDKASGTGLIQTLKREGVGAASSAKTLIK